MWNRITVTRQKCQLKIKIISMWGFKNRWLEMQVKKRLSCKCYLYNFKFTNTHFCYTLSAMTKLPLHIGFSIKEINASTALATIVTKWLNLLGSKICCRKCKILCEIRLNVRLLQMLHSSQLTQAGIALRKDLRSNAHLHY